MATFSITDIGIYDTGLDFNNQTGDVRTYAFDTISATGPTVLNEEHCGVNFDDEDVCRWISKEFHDTDKGMNVKMEKHYAYPKEHQKAFMGMIKYKIEEL